MAVRLLLILPTNGGHANLVIEKQYRRHIAVIKGDAFDRAGEIEGSLIYCSGPWHLEAADDDNVRFR
jgi:hypothetical protein